MAQFAQCFCFDLTDAFTSNVENLTDFLERVFAAVVQTETHLDDSFFTRSQRAQASTPFVLSGSGELPRRTVKLRLCPRPGRPR